MIALHAVNNTIAFGAQTGGETAWLLGLSLGLAMVVACMALPRFAWRAAPGGKVRRTAHRLAEGPRAVR